MATLQSNFNDYLAEILMSSQKRLLVEGPDDNRLFNRLLDIFDKERKQVVIDDAGRLLGSQPSMGNREKVEEVCSLIGNLHFSKKLVGFVDREFREFDIAPSLNDKIQSHRVNGQLVWSRGHSIENYYFDFETLREPISALSTTPYYQHALSLFEKHFENTIRLACVASLAGLELGNFQIIRNAISWQVLVISNGRLSIDYVELESVFKSRNMSTFNINQYISKLHYWEPIVFQADYAIVRWLCHGHMGLSFIWSAFKRMVYEASILAGSSHPQNEVDHSIESREEIRFNLCAMKWIDRSLGNNNVFPFEVFKLLNLIS